VAWRDDEVDAWIEARPRASIGGENAVRVIVDHPPAGGPVTANLDPDYLSLIAPCRSVGKSIYHGCRRKKKGQPSSEKAIADEVNRCRARLEDDRRRRG